MSKMYGQIVEHKLRVARQVPKLGEILVARGDISAHQLAAALVRQGRTGRRLGDELVRSGCVKRSKLTLALRAQRRLAAFALLSACACSALHAVRSHAGSPGAQLGVSAFVPPRAVLQVDYQPPSLSLSAADVHRGYVDAPASTRLRVTSNSPSGYAIDFHVRLPIFKSVRVSSSEGDGDIGPNGGTLVVRDRRGKQLRAEFSYRFVLEDGVVPGEYAWPLAFDVRPL